jgi:hypothetical protein
LKTADESADYKKIRLRMTEEWIQSLFRVQYPLSARVIASGHQRRKCLISQIEFSEEEQDAS